MTFILYFLGYYLGSMAFVFLVGLVISVFLTTMEKDSDVGNFLAILMGVAGFMLLPMSLILAVIEASA